MYQAAKNETAKMTCSIAELGEGKSDGKEYAGNWR